MRRRSQQHSSTPHRRRTFRVTTRRTARPKPSERPPSTGPPPRWNPPVPGAESAPSSLESQRCWSGSSLSSHRVGPALRPHRGRPWFPTQGTWRRRSPRFGPTVRRMERMTRRPPRARRRRRPPRPRLRRPNLHHLPPRSHHAVERRHHHGRLRWRSVRDRRWPAPLGDRRLGLRRRCHAGNARPVLRIADVLRGVAPTGSTRAVAADRMPGAVDLRARSSGDCHELLIVHGDHIDTYESTGGTQ